MQEQKQALNKEDTIQFLINHQNDPNASTDVYENVVSDHFIEFIHEKLLLNLNIPILSRIVAKYSNLVKDKRKSNALLQETNEVLLFLIQLLDKHGQKASVLFENIRIYQASDEIINKLLAKYNDVLNCYLIKIITINLFNSFSLKIQKTIITNSILNLQESQHKIKYLNKINTIINCLLDDKYDENENIISIEVKNTRESINEISEKFLIHLSNILTDKYSQKVNEMIKKMTNITEIIISSKSSTIANNFFKGCNSLIQITIPSSVTSIGSNVFTDCSSLKRVFIPSSVKSIGDKTFNNCISLKHITIPSSIYRIKQSIFDGCPSLAITKMPKFVDDFMNLPNFDEYTINEHIVSGGSTDVFKATSKDTGESFVIKVYDKNNIFFDWTDFVNMVNVTHLKIPGIISIENYYIYQDSDEEEPFSFVIVDKKGNKKKVDIHNCFTCSKFYKSDNIEAIVNDYLLSKGKNNEEMNPTIRSKIIFGIACTMKQLHDRNVIHRNLTLHNILLDENKEPKICSFSLAKFLTSPKEKLYDIGTPFYMAPEVINFYNDDDGYGFPVDVYSFAFCLYCMFTTKKTFPDDKNPKNHNELFNLIIRGLRPIKQPTIPDNYWDLIQRCWKQNPYDRPTFAEIVQELKNDKYALEEFGMKTDLNQLHEYHNRMDNY